MGDIQDDSTATSLNTSLAHRVAIVVRQAIYAEEYGLPGDRFLSVRQLAERFEISLVTAHRTMELLKQWQVLYAQANRIAVIHPQLKPQGLSDGPARIVRVGMVVTNLASPFFTRLAYHIQSLASQMGITVLLASSDYDPAREQSIVEGFLDIGVKAILAAPGLTPSSHALYQRVLDHKDTRLIFVSRRVETLPVDSVVVHNMLGANKVAEHLLELGHRQFGYIGFRSDLKQEPRLAGFRSALHERGIKLANDQIIYAQDWHPENGQKAMAQLMQAAKPPTAVFAYHDLLAIGAMQYCREHHIRVPKHVAIVGFDDLPESRVTTPALTTISYPLRSMAELALQMIEQPLDQAADRQPHTVLLEPSLDIRGSSDPGFVNNPLHIAQRMSAEGRHLAEIPV